VIKFHTWIGIRLDRIVDEKSPMTIGSSSEPVGSRDLGKLLHSTPSTVYERMISKNLWNRELLTSFSHRYTMAAFLLKFQVDSSGIFPNFPSLTFLPSATMLTCSGPNSRIASWKAFNDQLYLISTTRGQLAGYLRSSNQIIHTQVCFGLGQ
jgi:hypothetical protein